MHNIIITIKKELRATIRDKKSLLMMAMTPLFIPIFVILMAFIYEEMITEDETSKYNVGFNYVLTPEENNLLSKEIKVINYDNQSSLEDAYINKEIVAYVIKDNNNYQIFANTQSEDGSMVSMHLTNYFDGYNTYLGNKYLLNNQIDPAKVYSNISYTINELKGESMFGNQLILMAVTFTIMAITLSAIYTSTDSIAGEKERGTLETILTFPIERRELIIGKYFSICLSGMITLVISIILTILTLLYVKNNFEVLSDISFNINFTSIALTGIVLFFYTLLISGACIAIASFTKSFKEAQSSLTPLSLFTCIPMFLEMLNIKLNSVLSIIPVINHTTVINDILISNINYQNILITISSSIIYTILLIIFIIKEYHSEKMLFS